VLACGYLLGCASTTARGKQALNPGMTTAQVKELLGSPDGRSFNETNEAWQYRMEGEPNKLLHATRETRAREQWRWKASRTNT
jgi:hypothetical protein